ncbi:MAG: hypothetical protein IT422_05005 [Pirellulaceae bacterium]|nr:hypothetical protein [Pirellulaceae bacterium]
MPDIKGTLFWLAVVLALLIWMVQGCGNRFDKFREHRQERYQQWQEGRDKRHEDRQEKGSWRERRKQSRDNKSIDDDIHTESVPTTETTGEENIRGPQFTDREIEEIYGDGT